MDSTANHNKENHDSLRKLLKELPLAKTSADFEERLQRRIAGGKHPRSVWGSIFTPRHVPAFAYSLVALAVVGVVGYYAFFRAGVTPIQQKQPTVEETPTIREKFRDEQSDQQKRPDRTASSLPESGMYDDASGKTAADKDEALTKQEEGTKNQVWDNSRVSVDDAKLTKADEVKKENTAVSSQAQRAVSGQDIQNLNETPLQKSTLEQIQTRAKVDQNKDQSRAPAKQRVFNAQSRSQQVAAAETQEKLLTTQDSLVRADSLRQDSLRRAQRQLQFPQQIRKGKKPL